MRSRRLRCLTASLGVVALAVASVAAGQASGRIPTVTRLVKVFSELETRLTTAAHAQDEAALAAMLDPAFELREGAAPGTPVPREEWMRLARASPPAPPRLAQMAVHDFGAIATVSFADATATPARFVVDVWQREGDAWKLAVRYQAELTIAKSRAQKRPRIEKKY